METILSLLDFQVNQQPDKIAVECDGRRMSYRELDLAAERVCAFLINEGIKKNQFVGITGSRSEKIIIAMLGILKAGAAYIPLDSGFPKSRIRYMCEDSQIEIVIAISPVQMGFSESVRVVGMDDMINAEWNTGNRQAKLTGEDLAYMIYTSGSSGNPKGVMVTHGNLYYFVRGISREFHFSDDIVMGCITTMSFDFFFIESFLPLILGIKVVVFLEECQKDPQRLCAELKKYQVDAALFTPSRLRLLLECDEFYGCLEKMRELMIGGEQLPQSLLEKIPEQTKARIWNVYGPTEATIACSVKNIQRGREITVGKPFAYVRYYILDENREAVHVNETGELYIAGRLVSKGYYNKRELTEKSFMPDREDGNGIMYKTGDLAKYLPNGDVVILGRADDQVKVRGYRMELGEIENAIMRYTDLGHAVVKVIDNGSGVQQLCCFYKNHKRIDEGIIKQTLAQQVPEYMIPDVFIKVDAFSYTPNGKIDRKKLELPVSEVSTDYDGDVLSTLKKIWRDMTSREEVDESRRLFEIGGNSVMLAELCIKINKLYGCNLSMIQLFKFSSLREIADYISSVQMENE